MSNIINQQFVISGVGGQGVLFVTRVLAQAAMDKGLHVLTSETHGMAKRGGTVTSHIKIGNFASPLIRPYAGDGLLALKAENLDLHASLLKPNAWMTVNSSSGVSLDKIQSFTLNADTMAQKINNPKSLNLIMLGYTLAAVSDIALGNKPALFCSFEDIKTVLESRPADKKGMRDAAIKALEAGYFGR